jgi:hypothetical protein
MRIVLATPLYPPDVAAPAPYVKELARILSEEYEILVVAYAHLPETLPGVRIIPVSKRRSLPVRLVFFFVTLLRTIQRGDILYIENGASVELPALLVAYITGCTLLIHLGDMDAHERAQKNILYRFLERAACKRARAVIESSPLPHPELFPLEVMPTESMEAYRTSWMEHLAFISPLFTKYGN